MAKKDKGPELPKEPTPASVRKDIQKESAKFRDWAKKK